MNAENKKEKMGLFSSVTIFLCIIFNMNYVFPIIASSRQSMQNNNVPGGVSVSVNNPSFDSDSSNDMQNNVNDIPISNNNDGVNDDKKNVISRVSSVDNNKKKDLPIKKAPSSAASVTASVIFNMAVYIGAGILAYQAYNWVQKGRLPTAEHVKKFQELSEGDRIAAEAQALSLFAQKAHLEEERAKKEKENENQSSGDASEVEVKERV